MDHYPLPTDTQHVQIESRQYKLGIDLGEGIPRITMLVGGLFAAVWWALLFFLGVPILAYVFFYLAPPGALTFFAIRKDRGGRYAYVTVVDRIRYLKRRHRPIIPLPGHPAPSNAAHRFLTDHTRAHRNRPRVIRAQFHIIDIDQVKGAKK